MEISSLIFNLWIHLKRITYYPIFLVFYLNLLVFIPLIKLLRTMRIFTLERYLGKKIENMKGSDDIFAKQNDINQSMISAMVIFHGQLQLIKWKKLFIDRFGPINDISGQELLPHYNHCLLKDKGYVYWCEKKILSLDEYITVSDIPLIKDYKELESHLPNLLNYNCEKKTLVNATFFRLNDNFNNCNAAHAGHFGCIFRIHHSVCDGLFATASVLSLSDNPKTKDEFWIHNTISGYKFSLKCTIFLRALNLLIFPFYLLKTIQPSENHSLCGPKLTGKKLSVMSSSIEVSKIKQIKNATLTTVNEVLCSCIAGVFSRFFLERVGTIPEQVSAAIPISMRNITEIDQGGNFLSMFVCPLPVQNSSALERLKKMRMIVNGMKTSLEYWSIYHFLKNVQTYIPSWLLLCGRNYCTCLISSIRGPQVPFTILNNTVQDMYLFPAHPMNIGISFCIYSFSGKFRIIISVDEVFMQTQDEVRTLVKYLEDEVKELHEDILKTLKN